MAKYLTIYLIIISLITFIIYSIDKKQSKKYNARRISEATLLLLSILGGAFGGYLAMIYKHHKTKHWYFVIINILGIVGYSLLTYYFFKYNI